VLIDRTIEQTIAWSKTVGHKLDEGGRRSAPRHRSKTQFPTIERDRLAAHNAAS
jgi:hypothetical protein